MLIVMFAFMFIGVLCMLKDPAEGAYQKDVIKTSAGDLDIIFITHGTLILTFGGKNIYIDPSEMTNFTNFPKADMICYTHEHFDHFDIAALQKLRTDKTIIVLTKKVAEKVKGGIVMKNGDTQTAMSIKIEAIPAYNIKHKRPDGAPFHGKGEGNGYILTFGDKRVYIAGDTENIPEMKALKNIDIAFLPMNLPYTMTPEMVADAAKAFKPKVLYPYHFGETDTSKLTALLKDNKEIEVRIRNMK